MGAAQRQDGGLVAPSAQHGGGDMRIAPGADPILPRTAPGNGPPHDHRARRRRVEQVAKALGGDAEAVHLVGAPHRIEGGESRTQGETLALHGGTERPLEPSAATRAAPRMSRRSRGRRVRLQCPAHSSIGSRPCRVEGRANGGEFVRGRLPDAAEQSPTLRHRRLHGHPVGEDVEIAERRGGASREAQAPPDRPPADVAEHGAERAQEGAEPT